MGNRNGDSSFSDATRSDALLGLGIALIHDGRAAEAITPLDKYLSLFPEHEQALFGNAVALQQTGRHAEAVEQYRRVLARNPKCEEALSNLVAMFLEKKDHESVRRYAETMESETQHFYERAAAKVSDASTRKLLGDLAELTPFKNSNECYSN